MRFLLDSNIWRYVSDLQLEGQVQKQIKQSKAAVLIAPAVVYEALRVADDALRRRLTSLMVLPAWSRLMPEAYYESMEVLAEIRRVCPEVLYKGMKPTSFGRLKQDWRQPKGGFWEKVKDTPELIAKVIGTADGGTLDIARAQAKDHRSLFQKSGVHFDKLDIREMRAKPMGILPGWYGDDIEIWRAESTTSFRRHILHPLGEGNAYLEWLEHAFDVKKFVTSGPEYVRFWFYKVDTARMPRHWARFNSNLLMGTRKISPGTPCDSQLSTHLFDADLFLSSDKVFVDVVNKLVPFAPKPMASAVLLPTGEKFSEALLEILGRT